MSVQLYLHLDAPARAFASVHPELLRVVDAVEGIWPATVSRIAEALGEDETTTRDLLRRAINAGLVERSGRHHNATEKALGHLLDRRGAA